MNLEFYKYQGAGNDFVMLDDRENKYNLSSQQIALLCHRHFGIGADGLIRLKSDKLSDFEMIYYNADGNESTMCGNGGRCIVAFAKKLGIIEKNTQFKAIDGRHKASIKGIEVNLEMTEVSEIEQGDDHYVLNSGSPHYVLFVDNIMDAQFVEKARSIRNNERFQAEGINVNFVQVLAPNKLAIRTFERGVEGETLSCGTGIVAASLAYARRQNQQKVETYVIAKGGNLTVDAQAVGEGFQNIHLIGKAIEVYSGKITID